jgi:hypothetical protein
MKMQIIKFDYKYVSLACLLVFIKLSDAYLNHTMSYIYTYFP